MKKLISIFIALTILMSPVFVFGQSTTYPDNYYTDQPSGAYSYPTNAPIQGTSGYNPNVNTAGAPRAIIIGENGSASTPNVGAQASGASGGTSQTSGGSTGSTNQAAATGGSCYIGSMLGTMIQNLMSNTVESVATTLVPIKSVKSELKDTGGTFTPSLDGIGFCLINTIIEYIGSATVKWINSGFKDNPVFIDDPGKFFGDIADIEAGNMLNEMSGGYLCGPLRAPVRLNLANSYNNKNFNRRAQCTFSGATERLERFTSGQSFSWNDWVSYTQNPYNNQFGATMYSQIELDSRIAKALGVESKLADWGKGFLSFKDPETKKVYTPGSMIEDQLNKQLDNPRQRLMVADEFDEVVSALVNQLIKIALNEITGTGNNNSNSGYYGGNGRNRNNADTNTTFTAIQTTGVDPITPNVSWNTIESTYTNSNSCSAPNIEGTPPPLDACFLPSSVQYVAQGIKDVADQMKQFARGQGDSASGITAQGSVSAIVLEFTDGTKHFTYIDGFNGTNFLTEAIIRLYNSVNPKDATTNTRRLTLNKIYLFHTDDIQSQNYTCGNPPSRNKIIQMNVLDMVQSAILEARLTREEGTMIYVENYVVTRNDGIFEYDLSSYSSLYGELQNLATGSQIDQAELEAVLESSAVDDAVCAESLNADSTNASLRSYIESIRSIGGYIVETNKFN